MVKTESYKEILLESLKDPETAAEYLTACLDDGDVEVFLLALRDVAEAPGGVRKLAGRARLNRESLVCCRDRAILRSPAWIRY
jgi:DNA-binding phage protein